MLPEGRSQHRSDVSSVLFARTGFETTAKVNESVISFGMRRRTAGEKLKKNRNGTFEVLWITRTIKPVVEEERKDSERGVLFLDGLILEEFLIQLDRLLQILILTHNPVAGTYCFGELEKINFASGFFYFRRVVQHSESIGSARHGDYSIENLHVFTSTTTDEQMLGENPQRVNVVNIGRRWGEVNDSLSESNGFV